MNVYFDPQIFLTQRVGGVSRYFLCLKKALVENGLCGVDSWSFIYRNMYLGKGHGIMYLQPFGIRKIDSLVASSTAFRYMGAVNNLVALKRFRRPQCDVIHLTGDDSAYLSGTTLKKPVIATVHDLIAELYPEHFPEIKSWLRQRENTFKRADHLICISECTKRDLKNIYNIPDEKISMVYHGSPDYLQNVRTFAFANRTGNSLQRYVLYVGDRKTPYKNFLPMAERLAEALKQNPDLGLVCVGAPFTAAELGFFKKLGTDKQVLAVQAHDDELFSIYANAACLILPSLYEGFGFPLLEAMKAGCPILSSNSSSLPEVGGNGALYFHPVSFEGFGEQLNLLLLNNDVKTGLLDKQPGILKNFSWQITARRTYEAYRRVSQLI